MQISWKEFIRRKFLKSSEYDSIGLAFTAEQVLACVFKRSGDDIVWELDASFSHQTWQESLKEFVSEHKLQGTPCHFALTSHWYKLHQIDRPNVADDDLVDAIKWPLQEATGGQQALVYDFVELPAQVTGQNKILVVAISEAEMQKLNKAIFDADLIMKSVTVEEFAVNKLLPNSDDAVITLVQEHGEEVVLNIVKNSVLYFSRRLKGFENIGSYSPQELDMGIADSLCVQIQRSMDFFESQLRQAPVKRILLKLDTPHEDHLKNAVSSAMGISCESFIPSISLNPDFNFKMASFSCLGAGYSEFVILNKTKSTYGEVANEV